MYKMGYKETEKTKIKLPTFVESWIQQSKGLKKNKNTHTHTHTKHIYFCFIDFTRAFDCVDHKKL